MEIPSGRTENHSSTEKRESPEVTTGWRVRPAGSAGSDRRGQRGRWLAGDDLDRFDRNVHRRPAEETPGFGPCWAWRGRHTPDGYPVIDIAGQPVRAHRYAWEHQFELCGRDEWVLDGPWSATASGLLIPPGWTLDHLCHTFCTICPGGLDCPHTSCVRPRHLEPLPPGANVARRHARDRAIAAIRRAA